MIAYESRKLPREGADVHDHPSKVTVNASLLHSIAPGSDDPYDYPILRALKLGRSRLSRRLDSITIETACRARGSQKWPPRADARRP